MKVTLTLFLLSTTGLFSFMQDFKMVYETPYGDRNIGYFKTLIECQRALPLYVKLSKEKYTDTKVVCKPTLIKRLKNNKVTDNDIKNKQRVLD